MTDITDLRAGVALSIEVRRRLRATMTTSIEWTAGDAEAIVAGEARHDGDIPPMEHRGG